ncbi:MAG: ABC transporter substrate-binding protein [Dehalococcoidia bacterium]|nr:ABC transporter substrate-binding protein [Dehalococcoidia bacterium]
MKQKKSGLTLAVLSLGLLVALAVGGCTPAALTPAPTQPPAKATPSQAATAAATKGAPVASQAPATPKALEKVKLQVVIKSVPWYNFFFGKDKGFYRDEGIDLEIVTISANLSIPALLSGEIDFTGQATTPFSSGLKGAGTKLVLSTISAPIWHIFGKAGVTSAKDLKGGKMGVPSLGEASHYATAQALAKLGLDPEKDVTYVRIDQQNLMTALSNGSVEAASIPQPQAAMAQQQGLKELIFTGDVLPLAVDGLGTTDKKIKENPEQIRRVLRATVKTLQYMKSHGDEVVQALAKDFNMDPQMAKIVWDDQSKIQSSTGLLSDEGLRQMVNVAVFGGEIQGDVSLDKGVDFSFLKQVLKEMGLSQ